MKKNQLVIILLIGSVLFVSGIAIGRNINLTERLKQERVDNSDSLDNEAIEQDNQWISKQDESVEITENHESVQQKKDEDESDRTLDNQESLDNDALLSTLNVDSIIEKFSLDREYSKVRISPSQTKAAYIDHLSFEQIGNIYIYDSKTSSHEQITKLNYEQPDTVKDVLWVTEERLALIIGYRYGTITQGGSIYIYDLVTQELKLVFESQEKMEYVNLEWSDTKILCKIVKWTDDNLTEYQYEDVFFTLDQLD